MRSSVFRLFWLCFVTALALQSAYADTLDTVRARGAFVIGFRDGAPPFSALGPDKQPQGYSIDLCNRIADGVKLALALPQLAIRYVPVTAENRIDKLESGDIDIECGTTTRTLSRQQRADFTLYTFLTGTELLVPSTSSIRGPSDLIGKKIAVQSGTTTEGVMKQFLALRLISATLVPVQSSEEGITDVQTNLVDAYASDEIVLMGLMATAKNPRSLRLSGSLFSYEPYALMVRKNDSAFRLIADRTLAYIYQSGEIVPIYRRWFGQWNPEPPALIQAMFAIQALAP